MGEKRPYRVRRVHLHDEQIRRLREQGLTVEAVARGTGLSRTYVERAVVRIRVGEEAELTLRRQKQNESRRRKRDRERREEARRVLDRDRVSLWAREHPEQQRERVKTWVQAHPLRVREIQRASYERNKERYRERMRAWEDAHVEQRRQLGMKDRERAREHRAELQRAYRQDPYVNARVLQANRERRQLIRRLEKVGLPPKSLHPATAAERRRNEKEATEFFTRGRGGEERQRIRKEYLPTPPELIERWERRSQRVRERRKELEAVKKYVARHGDQLRDEATLDSRARTARGATALNIDAEVLLRAQEAVRARRTAVAQRAASARSMSAIAQSVNGGRGAGIW
jgi:hypothetical protein